MADYTALVSRSELVIASGPLASRTISGKSICLSGPPDCSPLKRRHWPDRDRLPLTRARVLANRLRPPSSRSQLSFLPPEPDGHASWAVRSPNANSTMVSLYQSLWSQHRDHPSAQQMPVTRHRWRKEVWNGTRLRSGGAAQAPANRAFPRVRGSALQTAVLVLFTRRPPQTFR